MQRLGVEAQRATARRRANRPRARQRLVRPSQRAPSPPSPPRKTARPCLLAQTGLRRARRFVGCNRCVAAAWRGAGHGSGRRPWVAGRGSSVDRSQRVSARVERQRRPVPVCEWSSGARISPQPTLPAHAARSRAGALIVRRGTRHSPAGRTEAAGETAEAAGNAGATDDGAGVLAVGRGARLPLRGTAKQGGARQREGAVGGGAHSLPNATLPPSVTPPPSATPLS